LRDLGCCLLTQMGETYENKHEKKAGTYHFRRKVYEWGRRSSSRLEVQLKSLTAECAPDKVGAEKKKLFFLSLFQ